MIEKLIVIILIICATVGIGISVRRQRKSSCDGRCSDCALREACTKPEKKPVRWERTEDDGDHEVLTDQNVKLK